MKKQIPFLPLFVTALSGLLLGNALLIAQPARGGGSVATERIFAALGLKEGAIVGEIGAGNGDLSLAAARLVGATGKVYTSELGDERVKALEAAIKKGGLAQITVVPGDPIKTNFADACCDAIFMRNVYHHFADPGQMNASIFRSLKPGGRVAIVDFTPSGGRAEAARPADRAANDSHGVTPESVTRELKEAGFENLSSEAGDERWFMVAGTKPR